MALERSGDAAAWRAPARACLAALGEAMDALEPATPVDVAPTPTPLPGPLPLADMAAGAFAALGLLGGALAGARGGAPAAVAVDRRHAALALGAADHLRIDGAAGKMWDPITGYHQAAGGAWVYLHANFPGLRRGLLALLGLDPDDEAGAAAALPEALSRWSAADLEEAAAGAGVCAVQLRRPEQWAAHPHAAWLAAQPLIRLSNAGEAAPRPLPPLGPEGALAPAAGLRVLDLTRVIAGPMAGRALAELGADVLRLSAPHLHYAPGLVVDTGHGKRSASVDLDTRSGRAQFEALVREADIVLNAYRPGALAAKGYGREALAALRPGLALVEISAFGADGPWGGRRGFDTYVQAATGLALEGADGAETAPRRLACQPLDYLTGCLGAVAALSLRRRQAQSGGAPVAELALARTASWIAETAARQGPEPSPASEKPGDGEAEPFCAEVPSAHGRVRSLAPPLQLGGAPLTWRAPPPVHGADAPEWRTV